MDVGVGVGVGVVWVWVHSHANNLKCHGLGGGGVTAPIHTVSPSLSLSPSHTHTNLLFLVDSPSPLLRSQILPGSTVDMLLERQRAADEIVEAKAREEEAKKQEGRITRSSHSHRGFAAPVSSARNG